MTGQGLKVSGLNLKRRGWFLELVNVVKSLDVTN